MWQLLLKILEFVEWQYNSNLHKSGPNLALLRRYKSWNTSLESGELVQICTLWEQKLAHRIKECNSTGSLVLIFHLGCTPANVFCNFSSFLVLTALDFMRKLEPSLFPPCSRPLPLQSRGIAGPDTGVASLHLSSAVCICHWRWGVWTNKKPIKLQNVSEHLPSTKLHQY